MISFNCASCQMKFSVKPEFAGRTTSCPTCKQPLTVPSPNRALTTVAPQRIGEESCLDRMRPHGDATMAYPPAALAPPLAVAVHPVATQQTKERYVIENEIARGGMGAVLRAVDNDLRRAVAVKYMLDEKDPRKKVRFVEEAQINAQLEHPNIVPIYDLRIDPVGRPYLMMKLVKGRDLKQVLDSLRRNPRQAEREWTLARLLNILVSICNGLAFAHSHGVVHRDLKPANIMLGDFGEVYVMDWGLAKVLKGDIPVATAVTIADQFSTFMGEGSGSTTQSSRVSTSREPDADLTQEGAIVGTPFYMPPEQANGQVNAIDERSDVYSLGAILYEMLTLQPPVNEEGGFAVILRRVATGEILPPEQREPQRTRDGKVPPELAAIAMKALAKEPAQRYANVGELRTDIERFQEGKSVSAKEDTFREMAWKMVKRNRGTSIATAAALVVLTVLAVVFLKLNYTARVQAETERSKAESESTKAESLRVKAETAQSKAEEAYQAYQEQLKSSMQLLLRLTKTAIHDRHFDDALVHASLAAKTSPDNAEARLFKGELLITHKRFAEAAVELEEYRKLKGSDPGVQKLVDWCKKSQPDDADALLAFAELFRQQQDHALAEGVLRGESKAARDARQRLLNKFRKQIETAWPGKGASLTMSNEGKLSLGGLGKITTLAPVKGIPLASLDIGGWVGSSSSVQDLSPLSGMPLTSLNVRGCPVQNLEPLRGMQLTFLEIAITGVRDLSPLKGMPLTTLHLFNCTQLKDISPLKGMPLTVLSVGGWLGTQVQDLSPLQGMPLKELSIDNSRVTDLRPLQDLPLEYVSLTPKNITQGMDMLRKMDSVKFITIVYQSSGGGQRWTATEFWDRYDKGEFKK